MFARCLQGSVVAVGALAIAVLVAMPISLTVADYVPPGGNPPGGLTGTTAVWSV